MALIQPPPELSRLRKERGEKLDFLALMESEEVRRIVKRVNHERYLYWDKLKYQSFPKEFMPEDLWLYVKTVRAGNFRPAPFTDKSGRPFSYWIPDLVLKSLNEIDQWSGKLLTADQTVLPSKERYIISSLMEEAIASSQLEGASTTRKVAKDMLRTGRPPKDRHERMILNNWNIIQFVRERPTMRLTPDLLREIHAMVTEGTMDHPDEAGRFRTSQDAIIVEYQGETVHVPPAAESLPDRLKAFCAFVNQDDPEEWIHPVIKAVMVHFWLAYDHPFTDGNGRTARALFYWYMLSRGYSVFEYASISRYFVRAPGQYVRAYVYTELDEGDLTYFLDFHLHVICLALRDVRQYLVRKQLEIQRASQSLQGFRGLNLRQKGVLDQAMRKGPGHYTIRAHMNYHGVVYQTARQDLLELAKKGFLKTKKQGKEFVFVPAAKMLEMVKP